jgi:non-canonical purine NTP pyrophosphatase (RdgB/HAM1 family)
MSQNDWVFVTSNPNKVREAERILGSSLQHAALELPELQAETVAAVALAKAQEAFLKLGRPVIVEDAGIELVALGGFPGPFIKYWEKLGGLRSICRTADGLGDRRVRAVCALGIWHLQCGRSRRRGRRHRRHRCGGSARPKRLRLGRHLHTRG